MTDIIDINAAFSPDCSPSLIAPEDLHNGINGGDEYVRKYYASELLNTDLNIINNSNVFTEIPAYETAKIFSDVLALLEMNDVCDKEGIQFLANVYTQACDHSDKNIFAQRLCQILTEADEKIVTLAINHNKYTS